MIRKLLSQLDVGWAISRLKAMSVPEVWGRMREEWLASKERAALGQLPLEGIDQAVEAYINGQGGQFFFDRQDEFPEIFSQNWAATVQKADQICRHQFQLFGRWFDYSDVIDWHRDPRTGRAWPLTFYRDIDIRDGETVGGVKWVWEMNRHHHLVTLGKAYWHTKEERYAGALVDQLQTWMEQNPRYVGVNWSNPLELSVRLINWVFALEFIRDSQVRSRPWLEHVLAFVRAQTTFIDNHLSAYSSANNHLIGEAAGLAVVGLAFPEFAESKRWRDKGLRILEKEVAKQIYPDGAPAEQAFAYLGFILDFNLLAWQLARLNGIEPAQIWLQRLEAACDFIVHIMDADGRLPAVGDVDQGQVVCLDDRPDANAWRSRLVSAAILLNRADFKSGHEHWDERNQWLFGMDGQTSFESLATTVDVNSRLFPDGGYAVMRAGDRMVLLDHGPLGYLSLAAHGHADALQMLLSVDGKPIVEDAGTYAYQEGGAWRDYFRSTSAHNTVTVAGKNQSQIAGTFLWGSRARARLLAWRSTDSFDYWCADHDGYESLNLNHRREVLFLKPDWLLVVDTLIGAPDKEFEQRWHFHPSAKVELASENLARITSGRTVISLALNQEWWEQAKFSLETGWISLNYGSKEKRPVLVVRGISTGNTRLGILFQLDAARKEWDGDYPESLLALYQRLRHA